MPNDDPNPQAAMVRSFGEQLAEINGGAVADQAALELAELVKAVMASGRKGSLVLKVEVSPFKGNSRTVQVAASSTLKAPREDAHAGVFFTGDGGQLFRNDPSQGQLNLGLADTPRPGAERPIR